MDRCTLPLFLSPRLTDWLKNTYISKHKWQSEIESSTSVTRHVYFGQGCPEQRTPQFEHKNLGSMKRQEDDGETNWMPIEDRELRFRPAVGQR